MAVKTITITTEAYQAIKGMKRGDESFSELFLRIAPKRVTAKDIRGTLKLPHEEVEAWQERIRLGRRDFDSGMEKRIDDLRTRLKRLH